MSEIESGSSSSLLSHLVDAARNENDGVTFTSDLVLAMIVFVMAVETLVVGFYMYDVKAKCLLPTLLNDRSKNNPEFFSDWCAQHNLEVHHLAWIMVMQVLVLLIATGGFYVFFGKELRRTLAAISAEMKDVIERYRRPAVEQMCEAIAQLERSREPSRSDLDKEDLSQVIPGFSGDEATQIQNQVRMEFATQAYKDQHRLRRLAVEMLRQGSHHVWEEHSKKKKPKNVECLSNLAFNEEFLAEAVGGPYSHQTCRGYAPWYTAFCLFQLFCCILLIVMWMRVFPAQGPDGLNLDLPFGDFTCMYPVDANYFTSGQTLALEVEPLSSNATSVSDLAAVSSATNINSTPTFAIIDASPTIAIDCSFSALPTLRWLHWINVVLIFVYALTSLTKLPLVMRYYRNLCFKNKSPWLGRDNQNAKSRSKDDEDDSDDDEDVDDLEDNRKTADCTESHFLYEALHASRPELILRWSALNHQQDLTESNLIKILARKSVTQPGSRADPIGPSMEEEDVETLFSTRNHQQSVPQDDIIHAQAAPVAASTEGNIEEPNCGTRDLRELNRFGTVPNRHTRSRTQLELSQPFGTKNGPRSRRLSESDRTQVLQFWKSVLQNTDSSASSHTLLDSKPRNDEYIQSKRERMREIAEEWKAEQAAATTSSTTASAADQHEHSTSEVAVTVHVADDESVQMSPCNVMFHSPANTVT